MRTFLWPLVGLAIAAPVCAQVSYSRDVAPILSSKCVQCHDAKSKMGNLDLTAAPALLRVAGAKSADSSLYLHLTGKTQPQMPMGGHLTDPQIALFRDWIDAGAQDRQPDPQFRAKALLVFPAGGETGSSQGRGWPER